MRIAYEYMLPGDHDTGVEVSIRELLRALTRLLSNDIVHVYASRRSASHLEDLSNIQVHVSPLAGIGKIARIAWQQAAAPLLLRPSALDVYHATAYAVSPFMPVPVIVNVYDTIALDHPELTRWQNALHYRMTVLNGVRGAARIIVPSEYVKARILELADIPPEKVEVIPLGVSTSFRPMSPEDIKKTLAEFPQLENRRFILAAGNVDRKKNLRSLVAAFASLPQRHRSNLYLVIAGRSGSDSRLVVRTIAELGLADSVYFTRYVDTRTLAALYNAAEMLVYPSLAEGFGLPPLEAMACGCPVVASNAGALPETTGNAAILVDPTDVAALSAAVLSLLDDPRRPEELRRLGIEHAAAFTWEACARRVLDVYESVLQECKQGIFVEGRRHS